MGILDEGRGLSIVRLQVDRGALGKKYLTCNQEHKCGNLVHADVARSYDKFGYAMSWHPGSLCLAVPADNCSIALLSKADATLTRWAEEPLVFASLNNDMQHTGAINIVRFSPNGRYLASADTAGVVLIWDMVDKNPISKVSFGDIGSAAALFDLRWGEGPNANYLMAVTATSCGKAEGVVNTSDGRPGPTAAVATTATPAATASPAKQPKKVVLSPPPAQAPSTEEKHKRIKKLGGKKEDPADSDDDLLFADAGGDFSIESIKQQAMQKKMDDDEDDTAKMADNYADDADGFVDNQQYPYANGSGAVDPDLVPSYLHNPIEPSSTAFDEKRRRYMVWNLVGSIVCREEDSGNRMEIKFADISGSNKNFSFVDSEDFKIASLSYEGAFFANQPEDPEIDDITGLPIGDNPNTSDKKGSDIRYHAFSGQTQLQGANETFSMTLPVGDIADCVAVGMGWAAVATSKNLLRVFSSTGLQLSLSWLRGPVVCLTGLGPQLAVIYNNGASLPDGSPNLAVEIFHVSPAGIRQEALMNVPVTPGGSLLQWAGFSEDGILHTMDTAGMLNGMFRMPGGWRWVPLLDTTKASKKIDHKFWPICIKAANLCYVLLNGESKPLVYPQPVVSVKPMCPPVVEVYENRENKERAEAENARNRHLLLEYSFVNHLEGQVNAAHDLNELAELEDFLREKKTDADKVLLQLFNEACRLQRNAISSDIALRIQTIAALELAITVAQHYDRPGLARLLENVLQQKQEDELADQQVAAPASGYRSQPPSGYGELDRRSAPHKAQNTPPRDQYNYSEKDDDNYHAHDNYDYSDDLAVVTPSLEKRESSFPKKKNVLSTSGMGKPQAPPVNKFAQSASPSKKRTFTSHEDLRSLRSSPSPAKKKPALSVSCYSYILYDIFCSL